MIELKQTEISHISGGLDPVSIGATLIVAGAAFACWDLFVRKQVNTYTIPEYDAAGNHVSNRVDVYETPYWNIFG